MWVSFAVPKYVSSQLVAAVVSKGVIYYKNTVISCGLVLNKIGQQEAQQHFAYLQGILKTYPDRFYGTSLADSLVLNDKVAESRDGKVTERVHLYN